MSRQLVRLFTTGYNILANPGITAHETLSVQCSFFVVSNWSDWYRILVVVVQVQNSQTQFSYPFPPLYQIFDSTCLFLTPVYHTWYFIFILVELLKISKLDLKIIDHQ